MCERPDTIDPERKVGDRFDLKGQKRLVEQAKAQTSEIRFVVPSRQDHVVFHALPDEDEYVFSATTSWPRRHTAPPPSGGRECGRSHGAGVGGVMRHLTICILLALAILPGCVSSLTVTYGEAQVDYWRLGGKPDLSGLDIQRAEDGSIVVKVESFKSESESMAEALSALAGAAE